MDIRQLQYLVALARDKHFTRAAQTCNVSQPTLSGRIRQLEQELGVPMVALMTKAIQLRHPGIELTVLSQSSIEILRHLEEFAIDIGLTCLDNEPIEGMRSEAVYMERYCLLVRVDHELAGASSVTWAEAARQPLCLLTPDMQNRRIIDRAFRAADSAPIPRLETNSVMNLCANVRLMGLASVIPEYFLDVIGPIADVRAVQLNEPAVEPPAISRPSAAAAGA